MSVLIKWKTDKYSNHIEPVACVRETEKSVWYMEKPFSIGSTRAPVERKASKESEWSTYHDSWDAAYAYLLARAKQKLDGARLRLQSAQGEFGNVKGMKKPEDA